VGIQRKKNTMHYANGREAKVGDQVVGKDASGKASGGNLVEVSEGSTTCNGRVLPPNILWSLPSINIKDCLHVDDAFAAPAPTAT
jgi:hypothetical protein